MMGWGISFTPEAEKDLALLDSVIKKRAIEKLLWLQMNFSKIRHATLSNIWKGFYKFRVGDWRIVYEIEYDLHRMIIHRIERRDKIYKI